MSKYEMLDYDELQRRIGIEPGETWYCGGNPAEDVTYEEAGVTYNDVMAYVGRNPHIVGGLCLTEDINVNGLLLNHRDLNGTIWLCTGIEGWWTLPPSEIPDVPKPFWDGSLLTTGRYLMRTITISGCFIPPHPSYVWYNRDALIRVSAVVRGVGLLAMCGNENPVLNQSLTPDDPFYDPPKMTIIQTNDVPLIETIKPGGFTQFSLSFRCVNPVKLSVYEKSASLKIEDTSGALKVTRERYYRAFSMSAAEDAGPTTEYSEVLQILDTGNQRKYSEVQEVNLDSPIKDEELTESGTYDPTAYKTTESEQSIVLHNAGNYFAFPIFVFDEIIGATQDKPVTVRNLTTGESMQIRKAVTAGNQLVIDTNMRRVGVVDAGTSAPSWKWDDRAYLSLTSQWITLAPGNNTLILSKPGDVTVPILPRVYWRDTWIG
jgi:Siphovirus-type tail component, C-terminal domain